MVIFIGLQILQVIVAPIPGEVNGFIGGYLYGPVLGTLYSTIGLTIGSWLAFLLARWLGLPFVEKMINPKIIQKYDHFMEHRGILITFILFLIPGFPEGRPLLHHRPQPHEDDDLSHPLHRRASPGHHHALHQRKLRPQRPERRHGGHPRNQRPDRRFWPIITMKNSSTW